MVSALLVALCRNRGIPARLVTGLTLARDSKQVAQRWVEVYVRDQWLPMDPFAHRYGWVPPDQPPGPVFCGVAGRIRRA